jgi:RNA polymerase sigma-70 factor (ECF subfamily)
MTDEQLLARLKAGETEAFDLLFQKYGPPLLNFINRIVGDRDRAEDLLQETFLRVLRHLAHYRPEARFSTWIYRIATNLCYNELRTRRRHRLVSIDGGGGAAIESTLSGSGRKSDDPHASVVLDEEVRQVEEAIRSLPENERIVLVLRFYDEHSYAEIAEILACPVGTVKSRLHAAVRRLRQAVREE